MITAQRVFDTTMGLMDELNASGAADTGDTAEYKNRTLYILNILQGELYPYSDTYETSDDGKRPIAKPIDGWTTEIGLDDYICQSVMPYGLAAHLLLDDNPDIANFCQQRYDELKLKLEKGIPTCSEDITDVYGALGGLSPYNEFGRWA